MNKKYLMGFIACAALTVTSCSNDEVMDAALQQEAKAIQFSTYLGRDVETKGAVLTTDGLKTQGFGVFAYYTGQDALSRYTGTEANFMKNTKVTFSGPSWTYTPLKYWPNNPGDKVSFFAYAPHDASITCTLANGALTVPFTVNNTVKDQIDFLWNNANVTDQTKPTTSATTNFTFKHALSRIGFTVSAAVDESTVGSNTLDENTTIELQKIVLSKDVNGATGIFYTNGDLLLNNTANDAEWNNTSGAQFFTLEPTNNFVDNRVITLNKGNSTTAQQVNNDASYLMIIPQKVTFNVYVEYKVITDPEGSDSSTITNKINNTATINFESGKAYTLKLVLGMTSVKVTGIVSDWDTPASETVVNVPINTTEP